MIQIENLHFSRGERPIFEGLQLEIPQGKVVGIMGGSGCGKTTLLRLIAGQLHPSKGHVRISNQPVHGLKQQALYALRRDMGLLFQNGALFTHLSVFDNVAFPLRRQTALSERLIHHLVLLKLQAVGLRGASQLMPAELSGGMARRVALARAIALDPQLMMYDEPFAGLDPITMAVIVKLIRQLNDALGMTSIIVSHDVAETASIADFIYLIGDKKIIAQGSPEKILNDERPEVQQFMKGIPDGSVPFHYPAKDYREELLDV